VIVSVFGLMTLSVCLSLFRIVCGWSVSAGTTQRRSVSQESHDHGRSAVMIDGD